MAYLHKLSPQYINDQQVYNVQFNDCYYGYILPDLTGWTVIDGPPGTNLLFPTMKSARERLDQYFSKLSPSHP